jgi:hypothetical protein
MGRDAAVGMSFILPDGWSIDRFIATGKPSHQDTIADRAVQVRRTGRADAGQAAGRRARRNTGRNEAEGREGRYEEGRDEQRPTDTLDCAVALWRKAQEGPTRLVPPEPTEAMLELARGRLQDGVASWRSRPRRAATARPREGSLLDDLPVLLELHRGRSTEPSSTFQTRMVLFQPRDRTRLPCRSSNTANTFSGWLGGLYRRRCSRRPPQVRRACAPVP